MYLFRLAAANQGTTQEYRFDRWDISIFTRLLHGPAFLGVSIVYTGYLAAAHRDGLSTVPL